MKRKNFFLKVWENTTFRFTKANCWRMMGFYGCCFCSMFLMVMFIWMFFMPHSADVSTASVWGMLYLHFMMCVVGVAYAFLAVKNNKKAQLLDEAEAARQAYYAAPANTESELKKQRELWNKYLALSAEADR